MATLRNDSLCIRIKPLKLLHHKGSQFCWKYYEFSITCFREEEGCEREIALFNSELLENPFQIGIDSNSLSYVFADALKTGEISHFWAFEEMNVYVSIYPVAAWVNLDLPYSQAGTEDEFMIIFQLQENIVSHAGYARGGPAVVMYLKRAEIEEFHKQLLEEERGAFNVTKGQ